MIVLGELALWIALPVAIWGMVLAFVGGKHGRGDLVLSAERSVYAVFALLVTASAGIVAAFLAGTRYNIHAGSDRLLRCGDASTQLTWMDAKCGDVVFTPRKTTKLLPPVLKLIQFTLGIKRT